MNAQRFTCPCCGYLALVDWPGSYDICKICFWEDDLIQLLDPWCAGGANVPSLVDAQNNFETCGAMEPRFVGNVRRPLASDVRDPHWRKVNEADREFAALPGDLAEDEFQVLDRLYYWRAHAT
jgi:hypothetical protein